MVGRGMLFLWKKKYQYIWTGGAVSGVGITNSIVHTSNSFFKKLAGRLASTITCTPKTTIPHMMGSHGLVFANSTMERYFLDRFIS